MLTDEQKKLRMGRTGSSQIAALVGLSSFLRPIDVFRQETEPDYGREASDLLEIGELLEDDVLELYRRRSGRETLAGFTVVSDRWPFAAATPDALSCVPGTSTPYDRNVEAKTCVGFQAQKWGEGTDEVDPAYLCQTQWQMGLLREKGYPIEATDLPVLIGGFDFRIYSVPFDEALFESLLAVAEKFWREHILTGEPPPVDESAAYADFLKDRFPAERAPLLSASVEHEHIARELREAEAEKKRTEERYELARNRLRNLIGEAEGIEGSFGRLTWKANKKGARVFRASWRDEA